MASTIPAALALPAELGFVFAIGEHGCSDGAGAALSGAGTAVQWELTILLLLWLVRGAAAGSRESPCGEARRLPWGGWAVAAGGWVAGFLVLGWAAARCNLPARALQVAVAVSNARTTALTQGSFVLSLIALAVTTALQAARDDSIKVVTVSPEPDSPATPEVVVRDYAEGDYRACRLLWAELTEYHRRIYGDPSIGGNDPGAGFDDYLAASERLGSWVAESRGGVVGLTGLLDRGTSGEVEPVVVAEAARDQGIGRVLIARVVDEAHARGYEYLAIRPVARNVAAVRRFYAAGFRTLGGHVDLTMDLAARRHEWLSGASLHGLEWNY